MASTANFFNHTEEAFLLSSLQEVVKVWARGTGHADFGLNVNDGVAELKLSFTLGHPYDLHCTPPQFVSPNPDQDQGEFRKKKRHRKSEARCERDRARAQTYQASQAQKIRKSNLILPFAGKLLPVNKAASHEHATAVPAIAVPAAATPTAPTSEGSRPAPAVPAVTPTGMATPPDATLKTRKNETHQKYIDVSVAKKQLFPNPQKSPPSRQQIGRKSYQMKEEDIWTKLFM